MSPNPHQLAEFRERVFHHIAIETEALQPLLDVVSFKHYSRKMFLLQAGQRWDKLFYIHRGLIRLFYTDLEGRESNKAFFWEGHCIWPVAPHDRDEDSLFSVAAVEDATILTCPFQTLYDVLHQHNQWEKFALPFAETLVEQKFLREHDFLLLSAAERFKKFSRAYPQIVARLPDYHLATYLGITNVSLSRIRRSENV
ncbi:MAG: Crp/Fnr family transcriptional regulator [Anaerolineae bacterium]|nr:Crp/Fnr family transcriptional regulator [Anaerolineae bacterium]